MKKNNVPMKKLYSATLALLVAICLSTLLITACAEINQTSRVTGVTLEHMLLYARAAAYQYDMGN